MNRFRATKPNSYFIIYIPALKGLGTPPTNIVFLGSNGCDPSITKSASAKFQGLIKWERSRIVNISNNYNSTTTSYEHFTSCGHHHALARCWWPGNQCMLQVRQLARWVHGTWTYAFLAMGAGRNFTEMPFFGRPASCSTNFLAPKVGCALKCVVWATDHSSPKQ